MKKATLVSTMLVAAAALVACGEPDQATKPGARKAESKVWQDYSGPSAYVAPGWSVGDETSWQKQIHDRTQRGQNEYNRTSASR